MTWPHVDAIEDISPHQREQLAVALQSRVCCLTGGPGTGKTHVLARLLHAIQKQDQLLTTLSEIGGDKRRDDYRHWDALKKLNNTQRSPIGVMSPTGKAAVRITQEMKRRGLGIQATTIHSGLVINREGYDGNGWTFYHNESMPLPFAFLALEEQSMTEVDLMASVLRACADGTHVILVGDPHQLPPVGHGRPFLDMLAAGIPTAKLTETWRFSGRIAECCKDLREGRIWTPSPKVDLAAQYPENFSLLERDTPESIIRTMCETVRRVTRPDDGSPTSGFDPINDVQVICALNDAGPLSRKGLNVVLQEMQNPLGARIKDCPFRVRDKVVFRKNLWFKLQADPAQEVYVANGDIGTVDALHKERVTVTFDDRTVLIPKTFWENLELAYAITCHSSQGSQWPVVVALADPSPGAGMTCCREWWTTAWSRASRFLVVIGQRATIDKHSRTVSLAGRKTFLKERIREWLPRKLTSSAN